MCIERIADVSIKGSEDDKKVFVKIERRIGLASSGIPMDSSAGIGLNDQQCYKVGHTDDMGQVLMVEVRNIAFMQDKSSAAMKEDTTRPRKIVKPPQKPDFSIKIMPSQSLLFRFSALTFNAHAIHLDPQYCREVEGYRNLLLHGPLSLVLMLSVLRSQLKDGWIVRKLDYRNLAPLYTNEELRVCLRKDRERTDRFEVWIEGQEGGFAVKGSAVVAEMNGSS
jgi:hydroxyacyl-ACP dehydratase HTD2-like protein with hotdog domain